MEKTKLLVLFQATKKKLDQDADGQWKLTLEISESYGDAMREISKYSTVVFDVLITGEDELLKKIKLLYPEYQDKKSGRIQEKETE